MEVDVQTVNVGNPVELKCNSPTKFSACYFSKTGESTIYKMHPKATFLDKRLQCLCDHDDKIDPQRVCGLFIKEAKIEDTGEWKCEVHIAENNLLRTTSAMMTLTVKGIETESDVTNNAKTPLMTTNSTLIPIVTPPPPRPPPSPRPLSSCVNKNTRLVGFNVWPEDFKIAKTIQECSEMCWKTHICKFWSYSRKEKKCLGKSSGAMGGCSMNYGYDSGRWNCDPFKGPRNEMYGKGKCY